MKFQVTDSFFNVNKYGEHKLVKVGTYQTQKQYNALSPQKQAKCKPVQRAGAWSQEELNFLIELYLEYADVEAGNVDKVNTMFSELFPERSQGAVNARAWGILGLDSHCPKIGLGTFSQELVDRLHQLDPNRFPQVEAQEARVAGKLENLLAEIRG